MPRSDTPNRTLVEVTHDPTVMVRIAPHDFRRWMMHLLPMGDAIFTRQDPSEKLNRLIDRLIQESASQDLSIAADDLEIIKARLHDVLDIVRKP